MKIFAFDIGIASIGWAYVTRDKDLVKIVDSSVRIFDKAENPQDGSSLAKPRREARSARRSNGRKRDRMYKIKSYFAKLMGLDLSDVLQEFGDISEFFKNDKHTLSPWQLRSEALSRKLSKDEWLRTLVHIAKHRGYNNVKGGSDGDKGKVLEAIKENRKIFEQKEYLTVGQMMFSEYFQKKNESGSFLNVRNKQDSYIRSIAREQNLEEVKLLFAKQREFGNEFADEKLEKFYIDTAFYQRKLKSFENLVGFCKYEKNEKRAAKNSITAQKFIALTKIINTLSNIEKSTGLVFEKSSVISQIFQTLYKSRSKKITYANLRDILKLDNKFEFYELDYKKDIKSAESKAFVELKTLKIFTDIFEKSDISDEILDEIATQITLIKDESDLKTKLQKIISSLNLQTENIIVDKLSEISFSGHMELSLKALYKILPFMYDGKRYDEAINLANLQLKRADSKYDLLPPFNDTIYTDSLTNPVVLRAISEYRKVLNAMIKKFGTPHKIHIELTREVGKNLQRRRNIQEEQNQNRYENEYAKAECEKFGLLLNQSNILKLKLWRKQKEICLYSGKKITISDLKDENCLQIDHIYPFSRSYDDSQNNKVLVFTSANQNKANRTPFEWLGENEILWSEFVSNVYSCDLSSNTKKRLLNKNFKDKNLGDEKEFISRNLNDTSYISKLIKDYTSDYLKFLPLAEDESDFGKGSKQHVVCVNGALTTMLRHFWGLDDKNRDSNLHHAQDAMILALITNQNIKAFGDYRSNLLEYKAQKAKEVASEIKRSGDFKTKALLKCGAENFKELVDDKLSEIFVSIAPRRKVGGALHQETIYSKDSICKNDLKKLERDFEIGKIVKINRGYVNGGNIIRLDVFKNKDKFYIIPVYTMHFAKGLVPNKAFGGLNKLVNINGGYSFCFSLFKNDLVKIYSRDFSEAIFCYYNSFDSNGTGRITFKLDKINKTFRVSVGKIKILEKYEISPIGEISEFVFQERQPVRLKSTKRS